MIVLETERLYLRELTIDDAENMYLLNADEDVVKYTGDKAFGSISSAKQFLENYDHYKKYGYGRWAVITKENSEFIGWCGLKYTESLSENDIGFRLMKKQWNKGYATEAAQACIKFGFEKLNMTQIVGRAMLKNEASIKVLQKLGLQYLKPFDFGDESGVIYIINRKI